MQDTYTQERERIAHEWQFGSWREMHDYVLDHFLTWLESGEGPWIRDERKVERIQTDIGIAPHEFMLTSWSSVYRTA